MDNFAKIVKKGLTYETPRGAMLPQELWKLPLSGNNGFNLDAISRILLAEGAGNAEPSLVTTSTTNPNYELKLAVLKDIIADVRETAARAKRVQEANQRVQQLADIIHRKENATLEEMDVEELRALLAETSASTED